MRIFTAAVLACALLVGCSKQEAGNQPSTTSNYPKDAAAVTSDSRYSLIFTSEETGNAYYMRRLAVDEVEKMPEDFVITGEKASALFVPIKDGKIVDAPLADRVALGYKVPSSMLE